MHKIGLQKNNSVDVVLFTEFKKSKYIWTLDLNENLNFEVEYFTNVLTELINQCQDFQ